MDSREKLRKRIRGIKKDLENLWPEFRDCYLEELFETIVFPLDKSTDADKITEEEHDEMQDIYLDWSSYYLEDVLLSLDDYTKCLRYMARYTLSTRCLDLTSLHDIFGDEALKILIVNDNIRLTLHQPERCDDVESWISSFIDYAKTLLEVAKIHSKLFDESSEEKLARMLNKPNRMTPSLMVLELVFKTQFVQMCLTCLLMSEEPSSREDSVKVRRMLSADAHIHALEIGSAEFYKSKGKKWLLATFQAATAQFVDLEWQYEIIVDFLRYVVPSSPDLDLETLFKSVLTLSLIILDERGDTGSWVHRASQEPSAMDYIQLPNKILKCIEHKFPSTMLDWLQVIITDNQAAKLMCSQAIDFACNFKPSKYMINKDGLSTEDVGYELFLVPLLISALCNTENWTPLQKAFASFLANELRATWKQTLNTLRQQLREDKKKITRRTKLVVPWVINQWCRLGSRIGLHIVAGGEPLIGCFYRKCPSFLTEPTTHRQMHKCPCEKAQYCDLECRKSDWDNHKFHCDLTVND